MQGGLYIQDDFKIRKNLMVTGGVRYEPQTHAPKSRILRPAPGLPGGLQREDDAPRELGMFYDWLPTRPIPRRPRSMASASASSTS